MTFRTDYYFPSQMWAKVAGIPLSSLAPDEFPTWFPNELHDFWRKFFGIKILREAIFFNGIESVVLFELDIAYLIGDQPPVKFISH